MTTAESGPKNISWEIMFWKDVSSCHPLLVKINFFAFLHLYLKVNIIFFLLFPIGIYNRNKSTKNIGIVIGNQVMKICNFSIFWKNSKIVNFTRHRSKNVNIVKSCFFGPWFIDFFEMFWISALVSEGKKIVFSVRTYDMIMMVGPDEITSFGGILDHILLT